VTSSPASSGAIQNALLYRAGKSVARTGRGHERLKQLNETLEDRVRTALGTEQANKDLRETQARWCDPRWLRSAHWQQALCMVPHQLGRFIPTDVERAGRYASFEASWRPVVVGNPACSRGWNALSGFSTILIR
jgi:hypothetical protein